MRLCHLTDLHLTADERFADQREVLSRIVTECTELGVHAWLLTGDFFGHHVPYRSRLEERTALHEAVARMSYTGPVCVLYGNHDYPGDLDWLADIGMQYPVRVYSRGTPTGERIDTADGSFMLYAMPYPTTRWVHGADLTKLEAQAQLQRAFQTMISCWQESRRSCGQCAPIYRSR